MSTGSPWGTDPALLRVRHKVRALKQDEEGFASAALPGGVFGFTSAPGLSAMPLFARQNYGCFEVHKLEDGSEMLIGYMTPRHTEQYEAGEKASWLCTRGIQAEWGGNEGIECTAHSAPTSSRKARAACESARLAG